MMKPVFRAATDKKQVFLIPTIGWINERYYYGYPAFSIAFAWLCWRCKVSFFVKRWRAEDGK